MCRGKEEGRGRQDKILTRFDLTEWPLAGARRIDRVAVSSELDGYDVALKRSNERRGSSVAQLQHRRLQSMRSGVRFSAATRLFGPKFRKMYSNFQFLFIIFWVLQCWMRPMTSLERPYNG